MLELVAQRVWWWCSVGLENSKVRCQKTPLRCRGPFVDLELSDKGENIRSHRREASLSLSAPYSAQSAFINSAIRSTARQSAAIGYRIRHHVTSDACWFVGNVDANARGCEDCCSGEVH